MRKGRPRPFSLVAITAAVNRGGSSWCQQDYGSAGPSIVGATTRGPIVFTISGLMINSLSPNSGLVIASRVLDGRA